MRRLTSLTSLAVMLLLATSPVLACMLPEQPMSPEEQACCKHMAGDCAEMSGSSANMDMPGMDMNMDRSSIVTEMQMPASVPSSTKGHSCCQKTTPVVRSAALTGTSSTHIHIHLLSFAAAASPQNSASQGFAPDWHLRVHSPPPPAVSINVLRV